MEELVGEDCGATNSPPGSNMLMVHALYSSQFHTQKKDIKDSQVIVPHSVHLLHQYPILMLGRIRVNITIKQINILSYSYLGTIEFKSRRRLFGHYL